MQNLSGAWRRFLLLLLCGGLAACTEIPPGLTAVRGFAVDRYLGTWYEAARLDHRFERGLSNVKFFPLQSYEALPALLKMGDCHLVVQKRGAADAVLPLGPLTLDASLQPGEYRELTAQELTELLAAVSKEDAE